MRERFTPPDWRADGWFLERRHPAEWSRRTELVLPDHEQAAEADPLVGVHDELRLARLVSGGHTRARAGAGCFAGRGQAKTRHPSHQTPSTPPRR